MWLYQKKDTQHTTSKYGETGILRRGLASNLKTKGVNSRIQLLPPRLKKGMEELTGVSLENVKVHYNSPLPSKVQAHAYAQGNDIYLAPGQEHHLPHELGHIVQQALGMVQATTQVNGVPVNDDPKLELQATALGNMARGLGNSERV